MGDSTIAVMNNCVPTFGNGSDVKSVSWQQVRMKRSLSAAVAGAPSKRSRSTQKDIFLPSRNDNNMLLLRYSLPLHGANIGTICALSQFLKPASSLPAAMRLVAKVMDSQLDLPDVQYSGLRVLIELGPRNLGTRRYVKLFMQAMRVHFTNPMIQYEACRGLLHWMKVEEQVMKEIGATENLFLLMKSLEYHSFSLQLRYMILDIVRGIIGSSKEWLQRVATQKDVVASVMRLLKKCISDAYTQQIGLSILSWVIEEKPSRDIVIKEGGVEHLLHAMTVHPLDDAVQCNAAATLCWLIHTSGSSEGSLLSPSGLEIVLTTMKRFLYNPMVFGNSVCALSGAMVYHSREEGLNLPSRELAELTLLGMKIHRVSPKVHRNGLTLLRFLIINGDESEVGALILKNIDVLKTSMNTHVDDTAIQAEACGILAHLSSRSGEACVVIKKSGCVEAVVLCQAKHHGHLRVQHNALWFHSCLLRNHEMSPAEVAFGGGLQVLVTMTTGLVNPVANHQIQ